VQVHAYFRHGDRTPTPLGEIKSKSELWASRVQEVPLALQNKEYFPQKYPWGLLTTKGDLILCLFIHSLKYVYVSEDIMHSEEISCACLSAIEDPMTARPHCILQSDMSYLNL
jgi:hypothetical protein